MSAVHEEPLAVVVELITALVPVVNVEEAVLVVIVTDEHVSASACWENNATRATNARNTA